MNSSISTVYRKAQEHIKRLSMFFMASVIFFTAGALLIFFYFTLTKSFNEENEKIKSDYIKLQKELIKTRLDATYNFVQAIRDANKGKPEEYTKAQVVDALSKIRFGKMYIFLDTFEGDALLMNGEKLAKPINSWDLSDANGKKIIQEEIKIAKAFPDGGYLEYIWHEASVNKDMEYISFCRNIDDWEWNIGTGVYVGEINEEIAKRTAVFRNKLLLDFGSVAVILLFITSISSATAFFISKKTTTMFDEMNGKIDSYYNELEEMNHTLQQRVEEEYKKRIDQEALLVQQSKMAMMGEMLDSVAHQWKQPLTSIMVSVGDLYMSSTFDELTKSDVENFQTEITTQVGFMTQTMDELRGFFRPSVRDEHFDLVEAINGSIKLISSQLKNNSVSIETNMPDRIVVNGMANEIKNVILNIINNAKDQIKLKMPKNGQIKITAKKDGGNAIMSIQDNAGGILEDLLPNKLFEHRISSKGTDGSGIGLWLAKLIIERHKGSMKAYNTVDGAVFEITIPAV